MRLIAALVALLALSACDEGYSGSTDLPTFADTDGDGKLRIVNATGGNIYLTQARLEDLRRKGVQIIVDGKCSSACTLLLSERYDNACWTDRAVFRFHGASLPSIDDPGEMLPSLILTRALWSKLPVEVREKLPPIEEWEPEVWFELTAAEVGVDRGC